MRVPFHRDGSRDSTPIFKTRFVLLLSMAMTNPESKTINFARIRGAIILHLQLWPAKLTCKSSEIRDPCDEETRTSSIASSTLLDAAEGLIIRTYNIRESLARSTSEHSLYSLGADVDLVGPLVMI